MGYPDTYEGTCERNLQLEGNNHRNKKKYIKYNIYTIHYLKVVF
jgi:hypothetical protein